MMAAPRITSSNRWHLTRIVWAAELCLIPLSNNVASFILWQTGLALYPLIGRVALHLHRNAAFENASVRIRLESA